FDGEVIKKLFSENYNIELRDNVYKVSNVDILRRAQSSVTKTIRKLEKQRETDRSDAQSRDHLEKSIDSDRQELESLQMERSGLEQKIKVIDEETNNLTEELLQYRETEARTQEK